MLPGLTVLGRRSYPLPHCKEEETQTYLFKLSTNTRGAKAEPGSTQASQTFPGEVCRKAGIPSRRHRAEGRGDGAAGLRQKITATHLQIPAPSRHYPLR